MALLLYTTLLKRNHKMYTENPDTFLGAIANFIRGVILLISIFFAVIPYQIYSSIRDDIINWWRPDSVWILEQNYLVEDPRELPKKLDYIINDLGRNPETLRITSAEYPFIRTQTFSKCYAKRESLEEAQKWALQRGYKRAEIYTERFTPLSGPHSNTFDKWFFVKRLPSNAISILALAVDKGDHNLIVYPYRTWPDDPGFKLNEVPVFENGYVRRKEDVDQLPFISTHDLKKRYLDAGTQTARSFISPRDLKY